MSQPSQSFCGLSGGAVTDCTVCLWPPELLCLQNHMEARVRTSYLQSLGYSVRDLAIPGSDSSYQCQPQITSSLVTFVIPYSGCGTIQQVSLELPPTSCQASFLSEGCYALGILGTQKT